MGYLACFYSGFFGFADCLSPRKPKVLGGFKADKKKLFSDFNKINKDLEPALKKVEIKHYKISNGYIKIDRALKPVPKVIKNE